MTDTPTILMLEANDALKNRARQILEDQGWDVVCETVSKQALDRLEQAINPFHLFISSFKLPKMEGDDILEKAKAISPLTQRMLMVPSDQSDMVIRAINKAEINACIITPSSDQDLLNQVKSCLSQFAKEIKHEQLKRVIAHQNKQMFVVAQRLKKKDKTCQEQIKDKKNNKIKLVSKLSHAKKQKKDPVTIGDRIDLFGIPITPQTLEDEFQRLSDHAKALFSQAAAKADLEMDLTEKVAVITLDEQEAPDGNEKDSDSVQKKIIKQVLRSVFSSSETPGTPITDDKESPEEDERTLAAFIEISISQDQTQAFIRLKAPLVNPNLLTLESLLDYLRQENVSFGIIDDQALEAWIKSVTPKEGKFLVAQGKEPVQSKDGEVFYNFETQYANPGKIMEDGRIDFRDRGEIPYLGKGDLMATKTPAQEGCDGISVAGLPILVEDPLDPVFTAGNGTQLSQDGLEIHSALDGQPHMDPLGEISVNPELAINGDVDFETGNIDFKGNIVVSGTIKEGFTVKGVNLTATEIEGAVIEITGDLHISDGINDATINSTANVFAKFINNSKIAAFGDMEIQKEIIDSNILISGLCKNPTGVIISSQITAKAGVEAGKIGTPTSEPAHLKVGVDEHIMMLTTKIETQLQTSLEHIQEAKKKVQTIEEEDQLLYQQITEKAQDQEMAENQIKKAKVESIECKKKNDAQGVTRIQGQIKTWTREAKTAEQELNTIFQTQDRYAKEITHLKANIDQMEKSNKDLVLEKKGLREFSKNALASAQVNVQGGIIQNTVVAGPNTSLTLTEDYRKCTIIEKAMEEDGLHYFTMDISDQ